MDQTDKKAGRKDLTKVGFYGLGISNLGVWEKLRKTHTDLHVFLRYDGKCIDKTHFPPARTVTEYGGENARKAIGEDLLFLSPSVRRDAPDLRAAQARGTKLCSDAELFFDGLGEYGIPPFSGKKYAVTGSDGKSTVTALAAKILGERAVPCGNFGRSLSALPEDAVPVVELSSFQLMPFSPVTDRAVITNVTENHLNWHKDFAEYREAKEHLFQNAKDRILSADAEGVSFLREKYPLFCLVSAKDGAVLSPGEAEHLLIVKERTVLLDGKPFVTLPETAVKNAYLREDMLFAIALTLGDSSKERVQKAIDAFAGLPHRCRKIAQNGKAVWYDSSVDSTPIRTAATLRNLGEKAIVIVGGRGKNLSYLPLADALCSFAKAAVLFGENAQEIAGLLKERGFPYVTALSMEEAVATADALSENRFPVILSPASTSFDRYRNYADRGSDFQEKVNNYLHIKYKAKGSTS